MSRTGTGRNRPRGLLVGSTATAGLLLAVFLLLRFRPDTGWPTALFAYLPQWTWLVLPGILVLWSALARSARFAALNLICLCAAVVTLAGFEIPDRRTHGGGVQSQPIRVVTWNVKYEAERLAVIRRKLVAFNPDVICLQETSNPAFDDLLPGWYDAEVEGAHEYGVRVLSRSRVASSEWVGPAEPQVRRSLVCKVETPTGELTVVSLHLAASAALARARGNTESLRELLCQGAQKRKEQALALFDALPATAPFVVAGDHNTRPDGSLYRAFAARMNDCFAVAGLGLGYTILGKQTVPLARIDYIWCGNGVRPASCTVGRAYPSDHRPLVADVLVP